MQKVSNILFLQRIYHVLTALLEQSKTCDLKEWQYTGKDWHSLLQAVIKPYNNAIHESTKFKPIDAIRDSTAPYIKTNLVLRSRFKRNYKEINVGDFCRIFEKRKGTTRT